MVKDDGHHSKIKCLITTWPITISFPLVCSYQVHPSSSPWTILDDVTNWQAGHERGVSWACSRNVSPQRKCQFMGEGTGGGGQDLEWSWELRTVTRSDSRRGQAPVNFKWPIPITPDVNSKLRVHFYEVATLFLSYLCKTRVISKCVGLHYNQEGMVALSLKLEHLKKIKNPRSKNTFSKKKKLSLLFEDKFVKAKIVFL